jgi:hypothetical protein
MSSMQASSSRAHVLCRSGASLGSCEPGAAIAPRQVHSGGALPAAHTTAAGRCEPPPPLPAAAAPPPLAPAAAPGACWSCEPRPAWLPGITAAAAVQ